MKVSLSSNNVTGSHDHGLINFTSNLLQTAKTIGVTEVKNDGKRNVCG
jgi:hypothetical protein